MYLTVKTIPNEHPEFCCYRFGRGCWPMPSGDLSISGSQESATHPSFLPPPPNPVTKMTSSFVCAKCIHRSIAAPVNAMPSCSRRQKPCAEQDITDCKETKKHHAEPRILGRHPDRNTVQPACQRGIKTRRGLKNTTNMDKKRKMNK